LKSQLKTSLRFGECWRNPGWGHFFIRSRPAINLKLIDNFYFWLVTLRLALATFWWFITHGRANCGINWQGQVSSISHSVGDTSNMLEMSLKFCDFHEYWCYYHYSYLSFFRLNTVWVKGSEEKHNIKVGVAEK